MLLVELPDLSVGAPEQVGVTCLPQIEMPDLLEAACAIETRSKLARECLMVDEAVGACRADGLFVKVHGFECAALDTCDLRAHQRGAVLEILRAIRRPGFELSVVRGQGLDMLPSLTSRCGPAGRRPRECTVKVIL